MANLVFHDAMVNGVGRRPASGVARLSPGTWGAFVVWLAILAMPIYILNRGSIRTKAGGNLAFAFAVVLYSLQAFGLFFAMLPLVIG